MARKEITWSFVVNGKEVDHLTEEQVDHIAECFSKTASDYYTRHPDEFAALKRSRTQST